MDALSDVLRIIRMEGGVFLHAKFSAPWCIRAHPAPQDCGSLMTDVDALVLYHYVVEGEMYVATEDEPVLRIGPGEAVMFPRNDAHVLGSDLGLAPVETRDILRASTDGRLSDIRHGGGGASTRIVCGFLGCRLMDGNPLMATLPPVLRVDTRNGVASAWIQSSLAFAADEIAVGRAGTDLILAKLSELLFVEALRRYIDDLPSAQRGWLAGCKDPAVARALSLMHAGVSEHWTVERLAREVGMSRSVLAERFTDCLGEPPMHYLAKWRLHVAAERLRGTHMPMARIAEQVGFESEEAFSRAFKRQFGLPPATWRRRADDGKAR